MKKLLLLGSLILGIMAFSPLASEAQVINKKEKLNPVSASLMEILTDTDIAVINERSEHKAAAFLKAKNDKIIQYLEEKYPELVSPELNSADPSTTIFGLIVALYEKADFINIRDLYQRGNAEMKGMPEWLSCSLSVLGAAYGVTELVSSLGTFTAGSVWTVVKFVVKKYVVGWLGTAVAIYQITNQCFRTA